MSTAQYIKYCNVLYCTVLYSAVLYRTPHSASQYSTRVAGRLHSTIQYCTIIYSTVQCIVVQYSTMFCTTHNNLLTRSLNKYDQPQPAF